MATYNELDEIYERIDSLMKEGKFNEIDRELQRMDINSTDINIILAYLTTTLPVRSKLSNRKKFYSEFEKQLKANSEYETGLLDGLE
jgi:hypothetical protein